MKSIPFFLAKAILAEQGTTLLPGSTPLAMSRSGGNTLWQVTPAANVSTLGGSDPSTDVWLITAPGERVPSSSASSLLLSKSKSAFNADLRTTLLNELQKNNFVMLMPMQDFLKLLSMVSVSHCQFFKTKTSLQFLKAEQYLAMPAEQRTAAGPLDPTFFWDVGSLVDLSMHPLLIFVYIRMLEELGLPVMQDWPSSSAEGVAA